MALIPARSALAFVIVSSHSACGSESATIPPPVCTNALAARDDSGSNGDIQANRPVEAEVADGAGVDAADCRLELVNDLHGANLRSAGDRAARETWCGGYR